MYSHLTKGGTVGQLLSRRLLRTLTGLPGLVFDGIIAAFWVPSYRNYWDDASISYLDDTKVGFFQGVFGYIGEITGYVAGWLVGATIGVAAYILDSTLWSLRAMQEWVYSSAESIGESVAEAPLLDDLPLIRHPKDYISGMWNLGAAILGGALGIVPYTAAKALEFFLPIFGKVPSQTIAGVAGFVGGVTASIAAIPLFPAVYLVQKAMDLYGKTRETIRYGIAVLYAKTGESPAKSSTNYRGQLNHDYPVPDAAMHSDEFRAEVESAKATPLAIILGLRKAAAIAEPSAPARTLEQIDAYTLEPLGEGRGIPTLLCPRGHAFNDDSRTNSQGIRFWVRRNGTCPIDRQPVTEGQLYPNRAFDELLQARR